MNLSHSRDVNKEILDLISSMLTTMPNLKEFLLYLTNVNNIEEFELEEILKTIANLHLRKISLGLTNCSNLSGECLINFMELL